MIEQIILFIVFVIFGIISIVLYWFDEYERRIKKVAEWLGNYSESLEQYEYSTGKLIIVHPIYSRPEMYLKDQLIFKYGKFLITNKNCKIKLKSKINELHELANKVQHETIVNDKLQKKIKLENLNKLCEDEL